MLSTLDFVRANVSRARSERFACEIKRFINACKCPNDKTLGKTSLAISSLTRLPLIRSSPTATDRPDRSLSFVPRVRATIARRERGGKRDVLSGAVSTDERAAAINQNSEVIPSVSRFQIRISGRGGWFEFHRGCVRGFPSHLSGFDRVTLRRDLEISEKLNPREDGEEKKRL